MKGYLFLLIITISGCSTQFATRKEFIPYAYDFTPYSAKGFLFTPLELIDRPYDGRGMIHIDGFPEVKAITEMVAYESGQVSPKQKLVPGRVDASEMIEQAYQMATGMGADAIISFRLTTRDGLSKGNVSVVILELSGFAIKRL